MYEAKWTTMAKRHLLFVDDNFHFMDEGERIGPIEFDTSDAALAEARRIVDVDLAGYFKPGMTAAQVYELYVAFGDDPFIVSDDPAAQSVSARRYAERRCKELCG